MALSKDEKKTLDWIGYIPMQPVTKEHIDYLASDECPRVEQERQFILKQFSDIESMKPNKIAGALSVYLCLYKSLGTINVLPKIAIQIDDEVEYLNNEQAEKLIRELQKLVNDL